MLIYTHIFCFLKCSRLQNNTFSTNLCGCASCWWLFLCLIFLGLIFSCSFASLGIPGRCPAVGPRHWSSSHQSNCRQHFCAWPSLAWCRLHPNGRDLLTLSPKESVSQRRRAMRVQNVSLPSFWSTHPSQTIAMHVWWPRASRGKSIILHGQGQNPRARHVGRVARLNTGGAHCGLSRVPFDTSLGAALLFLLSHYLFGHHWDAVMHHLVGLLPWQ